MANWTLSFIFYFSESDAVLYTLGLNLKMSWLENHWHWKERRKQLRLSCQNYFMQMQFAFYAFASYMRCNITYSNFQGLYSYAKVMVMRKIIPEWQVDVYKLYPHYKEPGIFCIQRCGSRLYCHGERRATKTTPRGAGKIQDFRKGYVYIVLGCWLIYSTISNENISVNSDSKGDYESVYFHAGIYIKVPSIENSVGSSDRIAKIWILAKFSCRCQCINFRSFICINMKT